MIDNDNEQNAPPTILLPTYTCRDCGQRVENTRVEDLSSEDEEEPVWSYVIGCGCGHRTKYVGVEETYPNGESSLDVFIDYELGRGHWDRYHWRDRPPKGIVTRD